MPLSKILPSGVSQPTPVNAIINGNMSCSQRGTSSTGLGASSGYFTVDRFRMICDNTAGRFTMSQDNDAPEGFSKSLKFACTTADTSIASGESLQIVQKIESQNMQHFKKGTSNALPFAVSFYVKGNASATYVAELEDYDNSSRHVGKTFNVTTDWTRVEITFPADTTGVLGEDNDTGIALNIHLHSGSFNAGGTLRETWGTLSQADRVGGGKTSFFDSTDRTFFITGVQLTAGSVHHDFIHESYAETLAKCQRYYEEPFGSFRAGTGLSGTLAVSYDYTVQKRANPTVTVTSVGNRDAISSHGIQANTVSHCAEQFAIGSGVSGSYVYGGQVKADAEL